MVRVSLAMWTFCQGNTEQVPSPGQMGGWGWGVEGGLVPRRGDQSSQLTWNSEDPLSHKTTLKIVVRVPVRPLKTNENITYFQ